MLHSKNINKTIHLPFYIVNDLNISRNSKQVKQTVPAFAETKHINNDLAREASQKQKRIDQENHVQFEEENIEFEQDDANVEQTEDEKKTGKLFFNDDVVDDDEMKDVDTMFGGLARINVEAILLEDLLYGNASPGVAVYEDQSESSGTAVTAEVKQILESNTSENKSNYQKDHVVSLEKDNNSVRGNEEEDDDEEGEECFTEDRPQPIPIIENTPDSFMDNKVNLDMKEDIMMESGIDDSCKKSSFVEHSYSDDLDKVKDDKSFIENDEEVENICEKEDEERVDVEKSEFIKLLLNDYVKKGYDEIHIESNDRAGDHCRENYEERFETATSKKRKKFLSDNNTLTFKSAKRKKFEIVIPPSKTSKKQIEKSNKSFVTMFHDEDVTLCKQESITRMSNLTIKCQRADSSEQIFSKNMNDNENGRERRMHNDLTTNITSEQRDGYEEPHKILEKSLFPDDESDSSENNVSNNNVYEMDYYPRQRRALNGGYVDEIGNRSQSLESTRKYQEYAKEKNAGPKLSSQKRIKIQKQQQLIAKVDTFLQSQETGISPRMMYWCSVCQKMLQVSDVLNHAASKYHKQQAEYMIRKRRQRQKKTANE